MAERRIDFGRLSIMDYVVGVVLAILGTLFITGAEMVFNFALPSFVASGVGAAIGVAAWFLYLLKRNS